MNKNRRPSISILGGGSWGTTIAFLVAHKGHDVCLWLRDRNLARAINRRRVNEQYLPGIQLPDKIQAVTDLEQAVRDVPLIMVVVPSGGFRGICRQAGEFLTPDQVVIHATKGFEPSTHKRMSEILMEESCIRQIGVLSGPNIAPEIARKMPAGTVVASRFPRVISETVKCILSDRMRVYTSSDVIGVELAGALKNVVAIAAGAATHLQLGENLKALLITRGLSEIARLGTGMGAHPTTFAGVAGLGDLIATCASPLSRNHRVGAGLAGGASLEEVLASLGMVAEGVNTARVAHENALRFGLDAPLLQAVHRVVHERASVTEELSQLMALDSRPDTDWLFNT